MDTVQKQEYRVRDLPTGSITLFPTRAQVVRNIKDVELKPGINEISVLGLTPTLDPHSVKVEGAGSAVISDISVELRENQDFFQDVYPDSDDETSDDESEREHSCEEDSASVEENVIRAQQDLKEVTKKILLLVDDTKRAAEVVSSAESRMNLLNGFGDRVEIKSGSDMSDIMQAYQDHRNKAFEDYMEATIRQRELKSERKGLEVTEFKLRAKVREEEKTGAASKEARKKTQARLKQLDLKNRREARKLAEKARIRQERCKFWARSYYVVRITLDATQYTPISRRSSISSVTELVKPAIEGQESPMIGPDAASLTCDLSITYVTSDAYWSASYDLQLSTTSNTGTLFFDAQLVNHTSESWKDCKIVLSTSQAIFTGLQDTIPKLDPWHIKLAGKSIGASDDITSSLKEGYEQNIWRAASNAASQTVSGTRLIGISPTMQTDPHHGQAMGHNPFSPFLIRNSQDSKATLFGNVAQANNTPQPPPAPSSGALFGARPTAGLFGSSANDAPPPPPAPSTGGLFGAVKAAAPKTATLLEPEPGSELSFQGSAMEETGLTTTYDLPGTKSLVPSSTASKQRVAQIAFTDVVFSHTIVAKYRPGAFLKAKMLNASKITLLKGPVGLTLDGAFMGRSTLPRCSSGDKFTMSLGIDPAIKVIYPKPEVKRATGGLFSKEYSTVYTRSITITNTGGSSSTGGKAARLLVLDQVPISEDEKLRVGIVQPRGLVEDGPGASTGVQDGDAKDGEEWGSAVATLKKGGEVNWDVELNAGKSVKLDLEYDVSLPAGDLRAVQV